MVLVDGAKSGRQGEQLRINWNFLGKRVRCNSPRRVSYMRISISVRLPYCMRTVASDISQPRRKWVTTRSDKPWISKGCMPLVRGRSDFRAESFRAVKRIGFGSDRKDRLQSDRKARSLRSALNYVSQFRGNEKTGTSQDVILTIAFIMHTWITKFPVGRGKLNS